MNKPLFLLVFLFISITFFAVKAEALTIDDFLNWLYTGSRAIIGSAGPPPPPCVHYKPTVDITPSLQSASAGTTLLYTVSVKNNDESSCGSGSFKLKETCPSAPSGWDCFLDNTNLIIDSSSTKDTTIRVRSPSTATPKNYTFSVKATNIQYIKYNSSASAIYNIPDLKAPSWYDQAQSSSSPLPDATITLSAKWKDDVGLSKAILETDETGTLENKTAYGSPQTLTGKSDTSSFSWKNTNIESGVTVHWRIYASDTFGNWNQTDVMSFTVLEKKKPITKIDSPAVGSWQKDDFNVNITDTDTGGSGLANCYYKVLSRSTSSWVETKPLTSRICSHDQKITVGLVKDCADQGSNKCRVYAYAVDNAGNKGKEVNRSFSIDWSSPTVTITHSPTSPTSDQKVKFTLTSTDNTDVVQTKIYVDDVNVKNCSTATCEYSGGPYAQGDHTYYGVSTDQAGNEGRDPSVVTKSFTVGVGCIRANPAVSVDPAQNFGTAGEKLSYSIKITNNDNSACGSSKFSSKLSAPSGWVVRFSSSDSISIEKTIDSSGSVTETFTVQSPSGADAGNYQIDDTTTSEKNTTFKTTTSATCTVMYMFELKKDWNMFSIPAKRSIPKAELLKDCIVLSEVWSYNTSVKDYVATTTVDYGLGYWAELDSGCIVKLNDTVVTVNDIPSLVAGWNLIGAPSKSVTVSSVKGNCNILAGPYWYDPSTGNYKVVTSLEPGKGYLVKVGSDCKLGG